MDISDVKAKICFNLREKLFNAMLNTCNDALQKFVGETNLNFYHALALYLNNRFTECIRELEVLRNENDLRLASAIALIYARKRSQNVDTEDSSQETSLREYRRSATGQDYCNSAFVLYCLEKYDKALEYVEKAVKLGGELIEVHGLKGWILVQLSHNNKAHAGEIVNIFEKCVNDSKRHLDFILGLCEAYVLDKNYSEALNVINKAVVRFPSLNLPLMCKVKVLFSMQDYEPAFDCCNRLLSNDEKNYVALKYAILILLCRDGNYSEAAVEVAKLSHILQEQEPKNAEILIENGVLYSRICARNFAVLQETFKMLEKALYLNAGNDINCMIELGYQYLLQNKSREALKYYKAASKADNTSFAALLGLTLSELTENAKSDQVKQQIFFLLELETAPNPILLFMRAKLTETVSGSVQFLEEACSEQLKPIMNLPLGDYYLKKLDPDFLLQVINFYLSFAPKTNAIQQFASAEELAIGNSTNNILSNAINTLRIITRALPGHEEAQLLYARVQFERGEQLEATHTLNQLIERDGSSSDAHFLMAQIHLQNAAFERAAESLETCLSHDFQVRERPMYHLISGLVHKANRKFEESIKAFRTALMYMESTQTNKDCLSMSDKASIYIELINAHREAQQTHEAAKLVEDAMNEFRNTAEEARFMILNAENANNLDEVQKAIDMLSRVTPKESYYLTARTKLADIFLNQRKDSKAFLNCYQEMVQFNMSPESFLLLGKAYMKILEPDKALEAYNNALQMNPSDPLLMSKMGKALIDTHYYRKAVEFYKNAINTSGNAQLKLQLAELYLQLKNYDKSEELLRQEIEDGSKQAEREDLMTLQHRSKLYKLLADVLERGGKIKSAIEVLKAGRDNQNRVRKILTVEQLVIPQEELDLLVQFNVKLAEIAVQTRENSQAINFYKDALAISPSNHKLLGALAKLYMQVCKKYGEKLFLFVELLFHQLNHLELCQQTCSKLLALDADNETASVLMADLSFRKVDFDMAVFHFTQLVNKQPTNWIALVRLVEVLRRTGSLHEVPQYLKQAEQFADNQREPGFYYCRALFQWYSGNMNAALRNFNYARQDPEWGSDAIINMIEICINPDDEIFNNGNADLDDLEYRDSRTMALTTAERLLKELQQITFGEATLKCRLLRNFILLASKERHNIDHALEDFINLASHENYKDQVGPILGVASAYTLLKQSQRSKTQLKRLNKTVWTFEDAEYLERCWLLLADYYIQSSKYELASDLIKKVLQYNKASYKAHEFAGFVAEKEQKYKEAAQNYDLAWKFNGKCNPNIGYRLAYNLMKCKRYADAIDVGYLILKNHPEYIKIKKDILDKSINNLRT